MLHSPCFCLLPLWGSTNNQALLPWRAPISGGARGPEGNRYLLGPLSSHTALSQPPVTRAPNLCECPEKAVTTQGRSCLSLDAGYGARSPPWSSAHLSPCPSEARGACPGEGSFRPGQPDLTSPKWGWWERPRWCSPSPPSSKPRGAQLPFHFTCESFFPGSPVLPPPRRVPHSPHPRAGIPGPSACQNPIRSLAPFSGAGAAAEFRWNFEVEKHLGREEKKGREGRGKRKYDFGVNLQDSRRHRGPGGGRWVPLQDAAGRAGRRRNLGGPARPAGAVGTGPGRGRGPYLRLHCKTPVAGARGSSCRRRPGGAVSPAAAGGRARAAGCGPRRPWRAGGGGRGLGLAAAAWARGAPLSPAGAARVSAALRGRALRSGPHLPHKLSRLLVAGAARGAGCGPRRGGESGRGAAGGGRTSRRARRGLGPGGSTAFYGCVRRGRGPSRPFIAILSSLAPPPGGGRPMTAPGAPLPARLPRLPALPQARLLLFPARPGPRPAAAHLASPRPGPHPAGSRIARGWGRGCCGADSAPHSLTQHLGLAAHPSRASGGTPTSPSPPAGHRRCTLPDSLPPRGALRF